MKGGRGFPTSIDYAGRRSGGEKSQCWWTGANWNCSFQFLCYRGGVGARHEV